MEYSPERSTTTSEPETPIPDLVGRDRKAARPFSCTARTLSMVAALSLGIAETVNAQEGKGVELADTVVITAEVVAIDKEDRILTLLGPKQNVVDLEAGEEARNFDQIRVGDQLRIEYYESVAIYLGKPGTQPEEDAGLVVARSAKGERLCF